jgi:hypothetical protein
MGSSTAGSTGEHEENIKNKGNAAIIRTALLEK